MTDYHYDVLAGLMSQEEADHLDRVEADAVARIEAYEVETQAIWDRHNEMLAAIEDKAEREKRQIHAEYKAMIIQIEADHQRRVIQINARAAAARRYYATVMEDDGANQFVSTGVNWKKDGF